MKWLFQSYMVKAHIPSFRALAKETGIEYRTLIRHVENTQLFRVFELAALDEVLRFSDEDMVRILRGRT